MVFRGTWLVFVLLLLLFFVIQNVIPDTSNFFELAIVPAVGLLTLLGIVLIFMAARARVARDFRIWLILTGVAAVGIPLSAVLHNVVYGLGIYFFGPEFWGEPGPGGGDEPVFFFLALIVFPLLLIAGSIAGTMIYARRGGDVLLQD
jgi:hypothetical protein